MNEDRQARQHQTSDEVLRRFILAIVLPGWSAAGLLDWYWHRRSKIESTAGPHESLTHLLMAAEGGVVALAPLVFEIDAGIVALTWAAALAHEATAIWDVGYAKSRRRIAQYEQHTHSFMEALPLLNAAFVSLIHPQATRRAMAAGRGGPRFAPRLRRHVGGARTLAVVAVCGLVGVLPQVEEFVRCWRSKPTLAPQPSQDVKGALEI